MRIAVIPARGGSKRIPNKNIREFCGKPIIAYSIATALESGCFDRVLVSTDSNEIADIAGKHGADVPFVRPAALADDFSGTNAVVKHAIEWHCSMGLSIEYACCIYATAPFLEVETVRRAFRALSEQKVSFALTVTTYPFPIQRALRMRDGERLEMFQPEHMQTRSQDLEEAYHDAGQMYWGTSKAFLHDQPLFSADSIGIQVPRERVQDIDTLEDWSRAELMFEALRERSNWGSD